MQLWNATKRLGIVAACVLATLALTGSAGGAGQYHDATGDSGAAPDITGATVVNVQGQLTVTLAVANLQRPSQVQVQLFIDSDANPATGNVDFAGADYVLLVQEWDNTFVFGRWSGTEWQSTASSTVKVIGLPGVVAFSVNTSELSNTRQVNMWARTVLDQGGAGKSDTAPDIGLWNYDLQADGPDIRGISTTAKPSSPKAGRPFSVAVTAVKLPPDGEQTPTTPPPDAYSCSAKLAGRTLAGRGTGRCTYTLPKGARGKRLVVSVTVQYEGAKKAFQLPFRVS
jgi:hypothetical protein